jgi:hypothetical protein
MANTNGLNTWATILAQLLILIAISHPAKAMSKPDIWSVSLGMGFNHYAGQVERIIDRYDQNPSYGRAALHIELPGVYWTQTNRQWLSGVSFATDLDTFSEEHVDFYFLKFHASFSNFYFVSSVNRQGLYLRGDVGVMRELVAGDPVFSPEYYWGLTSVAALGYAFAITHGSRMTLQIHLMPQLNNNKFEANAGFAIGALF